MNTLAIAFLVAWVAVAGYLGWLGAQQRRLLRRLQQLELAARNTNQDRSPAA